MTWKERIRAFVDRLASPFSLVVRRMGDSYRLTLAGFLTHVERCGVQPHTIIDVGAAYGQWSLTCHRVFDRAHYLLVEPLDEYLPFLREMQQQIGATLVHTALASTHGVRSMNVHSDLVGSSFFHEAEGADVDGAPREVRVSRLDDIVKELGLDPPFLLKVDVQGAELDVLEGAAATLPNTELVILEASFFEFFRNGPSISDIVRYMTDRGFVPYDLMGPQYRPLDGALAQIDIAFVPSEGILRRSHTFAGPQQRAEQDKQLRRAHRTALGRLGRRNRSGRER